MTNKFKPKGITMEELFRLRLSNILSQLTNDQQEELFDTLYKEPKFQPEGYPYKYSTKSFYELTDEEIKYLHDNFIEIQFSAYPKLQGEDIRNVIIFPFKS